MSCSLYMRMLSYIKRGPNERPEPRSQEDSHILRAQRGNAVFKLRFPLLSARTDCKPRNLFTANLITILCFACV